MSECKLCHSYRTRPVDDNGVHHSEGRHEKHECQSCGHTQWVVIR
jgi:hypothetical protein